MTQFMLTFNEKYKKSIVINKNNAHKYIHNIKNSLKNGIQMKCNIDLKKIDDIKQHDNVIQMLTLELLINDDILCTFSPTTIIDIKNFNLILKLLWFNPLIMKKYMKNIEKWTKIYTILKFLLTDCKFRTTNECIDLILTITSSMIHLNMKHIKFLIDLDYGKAFCSFFRRIYLKQNKSPNVLILLTSITKIIWLHCMHDNKDNSFIYIGQWIQDITFILFKYCNTCCWCELNRKNRKRQCEVFHEMTKRLHNNLIETFISFKTKRLEFSNYFSLKKIFKSSQKNRIISLKICGNGKCKNNNVRLKICKKCRVIYYCSRHCQKISWNNDHKKQCNELCD